MPGLAPTIGAILLIMPGFITDAFGAALLIPGFRRWATATLAKRLARGSRKPNDKVIDLEPGEWRSVADKRRSDRSGIDR
jgi:UPF0716 family protein affecting phage T7 exclusion